MRTLRARVTAAAVLIAGVGLSAGAWAFVHATGRALTHQVDRDIAATGRTTATRLAGGASPQTLVAALPGEQIVQVRRSDGTVLAGSTLRIRQSSDLEQIEIIDDTQPRAAHGWVTGTSNLSDLGSGWRVVHTPVTGAAEPVGVVVAAPLADVRRSTETIATLAYTGVPVLVLGIGLLLWFALGRLLRPVEHVRRQAAAAVDVYPPPRLDGAGGGAEIEALIQTIDDLLQRAAAGVRRQRGFLADASHELLTPLASMRTVLEVAQRRADRADWRQVAARCLHTQARLEQVAQHLLTLARTEAGTTVKLVDLDLCELVSAAATDATAGHADVTLTIHAPGPIMITGDRLALTQLVVNLLGNAVRHAEQRVDVRMRDTAATVILDVDDDGPGIDEHDRTSIFEPFVRLDHARDRQHGGAGLGLSIVHAVATRHGGGVVVSTSPRNGARFTVTLSRHRTASPSQ